MELGRGALELGIEVGEQRRIRILLRRIAHHRARAERGHRGRPPGERRVGDRIGLALGGIAGRRDLELVLPHRRAARLLHRVRELVGDQVVAAMGPGLVLAAREVDILPDGERARADGGRRGLRLGAGVHADTAEIGAGGVLDLAADVAAERCAAAIRGARDRRLGIGLRLGRSTCRLAQHRQRLGQRALSRHARMRLARVCPCTCTSRWFAIEAPPIRYIARLLRRLPVLR